MLVQVGRRYVSEQREIDPLFAKAMQELLSKSRVFADTHEEFIRDLIVSCNRKEYPVNRFLMEEGTKGDSMFVLFKGVVEVTAGGRYICKLKDGSIVGEAALMNIDNRRTASVRSLAKCDVAIISRFSFHSILEKYPWEKRKFQREMKQKLMELGKLIDVKDDINLEQQAAQCDALKSIPFFANDESLHDFVAELAMNASSYWYKPGKVLIQEGDTSCDDMFVLLRGTCEMYSCGQFLGRIEEDLFGEICVLDLLEKRTASVITATPCQCMKFPRQVMIPVLAKYPDARLRLLEHAKSRLVALNEIIGSGEKLQNAGKGGEAIEDIMHAGTGRLEGCAVGFGPLVEPGDASLFASSRLFQDAPVPLIHALSQRLANKKFPDGQVILKEGEPYQNYRDFVYFITKGEVEVWKTGNFVTALKTGDWFGELAPLRNHVERQATVKAKGQVTCRVVLGKSLLEVLAAHDQNKSLLNRWDDILDSRQEQLAQKVGLAHQLKLKTTDIDFMFFKLPDKQKDDRVTPRNQSMTEALEGMEVYEWKASGKMPVRKAKQLPPLTAR
eukprot:gb/GFBE01000610.1/.p1 GENE.gb/GFBE01000610.1/~~gb/GFBE01000610.1/.p1  ORF type:complete len:557 (+),score=168.05 gb/GFBE01000610.1/:1-1671(+)